MSLPVGPASVPPPVAPLAHQRFLELKERSNLEVDQKSKSPLLGKCLGKALDARWRSTADVAILSIE
ncbi:hypothetical protein DXG01_011095 [Tephrocybe rancida]|nr:hypothetical protein DXG01_011095 [Tephrocybe rancida]